jgi:predicted dienelactone hydrolase
MKKWSLIAVMYFSASCAYAAMGLTVITPAQAGIVTVFYPTAQATMPIKRGNFTLQAAVDSTPVRGNGRLIIISHGSGASPWVYTDLASALVDAGFIVALPEHAGDNYHDHSKVGPASWKLRPLEVSQAIDSMLGDTRFAPLFNAKKIGVWGMSAGGHTALTLAGGRWSPAQLLAHCEANLAEDFTACTGAASQLRGNFLDGLKKTIAMYLIRWNLRDDADWYRHTDARIAAIVSGVPFAADFDMATFTQPVTPLGIIQAEQDIWLVPKFHSSRVLQACPSCELIASLSNGGHGALLGPLPSHLPAKFQMLVDDPIGFERAKLSDVNLRVVGFFKAKLSAAQ